MTIIQCDAKKQAGRLVFHGRISNIQLEQQNQHAYEMKKGKFFYCFSHTSLPLRRLSPCLLMSHYRFKWLHAWLPYYCGDRDKRRCP